MMDLVSIIVPVHNSEKYLSETVNSLLNQTYQDIEILLIDDGSTDRSSELCDSFLSDNRVKVFHQPNEGLSATRQFGIDHCSGKYFCTVDSDDFVDGRYVEVLHNLISSGDYDIAKCARIDFIDGKIDTTSKVVPCQAMSISIREEDLQTKYNTYINTFNMSDSWDKMYRTEFVKDSGVKFELPKGFNGNDYSFNHKLIMHCPSIISINEALLYHRIVEGSIVHKRNNRMQEGFQIVISQLLHEADMCGLKLKKEISADYYRLISLVPLNIAMYSSSYQEMKGALCEYFEKHNSFRTEKDLEERNLTDISDTFYNVRKRNITMVVVEINTSNFGSTGNIMLGIGTILEKRGHDVYYCVAKSRSNLKKKVKNRIFTGTIVDRNIHLLLSFFTGFNGCFSFLHTIILISKLKKLNPDVVHIHNLHNCFINVRLLFRYFKKNNIPVIWTLHDCWAFTGHCPYFTIEKCDKWKTGCHDCPSYHNYPESRVDRTRMMWKWKKKWFTGVRNMTIVTPSQWLADLVKQSYLKNYPVKVINNGIDLNIFKPTVSDFRKKYEIPSHKYILLGVAFDWGKRKGLDVFVELASRLDAKKYQIVLVGTNDKLDQQLPSEIISIHRTQNQKELSEIYTTADLFVNPTREENYPTVNMESIACGTPVLTFRTGGSSEILTDKTGSVVNCDDIDALEKEIKRICATKPYKRVDCLEQAKSFDMNDRFAEYVELYKDILIKNINSGV